MYESVLICQVQSSGFAVTPYLLWSTNPPCVYGRGRAVVHSLWTLVRGLCPASRCPGVTCIVLLFFLLSVPGLWVMGGYVLVFLDCKISPCLSVIGAT
jgi:hypothetical protein